MMVMFDHGGDVVVVADDGEGRESDDGDDDGDAGYRQEKCIQDWYLPG